MAKPILLVRVHRAVTKEKQNNISEQMLNMTLGEYHVMVINSLMKDDIKLEVFNADKLLPIDIVQIKKRLGIW